MSLDHKLKELSVQWEKDELATECTNIIGFLRRERTEAIMLKKELEDYEIKRSKSDYPEESSVEPELMELIEAANLDEIGQGWDTSEQIGTLNTPADRISVLMVHHLLGYAARKKRIREILCDECRHLLFAPRDVPERFVPDECGLTFMHDEGGGLTYLSKYFVNTFCNIETEFRNWVKQNPISDRPKASILERIMKHTTIKSDFIHGELGCERSCDCDWSDLFERLADYFVKLRLYFKCQQISERRDKGELKEMSERKKKIFVMDGQL